MVSRCGVLISRFRVRHVSPQEFVLPNCPVGRWGSRSSFLSRLSQFRCQSAASNSFDLRRCLSSEVWGGHGDPWSFRTKFSCVSSSERFRFLGLRAYGGSRAGAMEGNSVKQAETSASWKKGGRYCVLLTGHASDYSEKLYGGYSQMFMDLLGDPEDTWDVYLVVEGVFPVDEDLEKYDGYVLTGSRHDAHGSDEWILKLCALLQSLHEKKLRMLAICFGHQVISRALGGKTGRAEAGWELGVRNVQLMDGIFAKPYGAGVPPVIRVYQVHRDQVQEIPPGGELLGFSERTGIEIFSVGDHVLAIQGHPEFTEDIVEDLIDSRLSLGVLKEDDANKGRDSLKEGPADRDILQQMCKAFLKGGRV